ncbi:MAG TPA: hypothetical protein VNM87_03190, partial [Candidatus Udaeobacter sp.]|nr:hypothetical protein [Candidatus Udaeobacter sp.]
QHPGADTSSVEFRQVVSPLSRPEPGADPKIAVLARAASARAFHLSMVVSAALLWLGAAIHGLGIRNPGGARKPGPAM